MLGGPANMLPISRALPSPSYAISAPRNRFIAFELQWSDLGTREEWRRGMSVDLLF